MVDQLLPDVPKEIAALWREERRDLLELSKNDFHLNGPTSVVSEGMARAKESLQSDFDRLTLLVSTPNMNYVWKRLSKDKVNPRDFLDWVDLAMNRSSFPKSLNQEPRKRRAWEKNVRETLRDTARKIEDSLYNVPVNINQIFGPQTILQGSYFLSDLLDTLSGLAEDGLAGVYGSEPRANIASPGGDSGELGRRDRFIIHITGVLRREVGYPRRDLVAELTRTLFPQARAEITTRLVARVAP